MSSIPLYHNLSIHGLVLKELKEWTPSFKKIHVFLLFSYGGNYPVQRTLNYDAQCQNNALQTKIKKLLTHLQRMYGSTKMNTKKLK